MKCNGYGCRPAIQFGEKIVDQRFAAGSQFANQFVANSLQFFFVDEVHFCSLRNMLNFQVAPQGSTWIDLQTAASFNPANCFNEIHS